jgi:predicted HicB family RNase H-like nuclease
MPTKRSATATKTAATRRKRAKSRSKKSESTTDPLSAKKLAAKLGLNATFAKQAKKAQEMAQALFDAKINWPSFFREIMGVGGAIERLFPDDTSREAFRETEEYLEIQKCFKALADSQGAEQDAQEPSRVITVRLPKSLHVALKTQAHQTKLSLNTLCINKLLQDTDAAWIPVEEKNTP